MPDDDVLPSENQESVERILPNIFLDDDNFPTEEEEGDDRISPRKFSNDVDRQKIKKMVTKFHHKKCQRMAKIRVRDKKALNVFNQDVKPHTVKSTFSRRPGASF